MASEWPVSMTRTWQHVRCFGFLARLPQALELNPGIIVTEAEAAVPLMVRNLLEYSLPTLLILCHNKYLPPYANR